MRFAICLCLSFFVKSALAQDLVLSPIGDALCKPGVVGKSPSKGIVFDYTFLPGINVYPYNNGEEGPNPQKISSKQFSFKLKVPVIHKPKFSLLVGFAHYREEYKVSAFSNGEVSILNSVHDRSLKSSRLSLNMLKPLNEKFYLAFKGDASFNGDYNGVISFDDRYLKYNVGLMLGVKPSPNVEWGAGLLFRTSFVRSSVPVLPFGIYNHTFNDKWGIEAVVPVSIKARYNISPKSIILFGPEYESRDYSLGDINSGNTDNFSRNFMKHSELRLTVAFERQISDWVWFNVQTGYTHNFNTSFTGVDFKGTVLAPQVVAPADGVFFKVGVFVSPPSNKSK